MSGRILIVDAVATNRIVLKVKMLSAQFAVDACACRAEAEIIIATNRPDLILINLSDPGEDRHDFCRALRADPATASIAIIAVGVADTSRARLAALDAGADDVLPRPMNDALLLARIRSLLRARSAQEELMLRDSTTRALGFEEGKTAYETPAQVVLLTPNDRLADTLIPTLRDVLHHSVRRFDPARVLKESGIIPPPDLFVIDATAADNQQSALFGLVSDLRSRNETRHATQLIVVPPGRPQLAAMFLDLGADDTVFKGTDDAEIRVRAKALIRRKQQHDRLRDLVRNGLHAAITDPLTGLYNRRYVESHLARMAEAARQTGTELAVMMLDIDHFKSINDTYGHAAGDRVLIQLADRLRDNLRAVDLVARVGGEEFLVALPRTTATRADGTANRLRRLVNCRPFDLGPGYPPLRVTVSVGVAVSSSERPEQLQLDIMRQQADAALYAAKSAGRDQVALSRSAA